MARYDDPINYSKTLVLETSDGQVTLTQNEAREVQFRLEQDPRYLHLYDADTKQTTVYDTKECGFCKVAVISSGKQSGEALPCEDPVPNCTPEYEYEEVTPVGTENPSEEGWYEKDAEGTYFLSADETVDEDKTYYIRKEA